MNKRQFILADKLEELFSADLCKSLQKAEAWVLVYSHRKIVLEKMNSLSPQVTQLTFNNISKMLIFSPEDELKIWVYQGEVKYRLWSELHQEHHNEYEEKMLLWGNRKDGNTLVEDGRGCRLEFPVDIAQYELPLHLLVKNYYTFDENGLIRFEDARLVEIEDHQNREVR